MHAITATTQATVLTYQCGERDRHDAETECDGIHSQKCSGPVLGTTNHSHRHVERQEKNSVKSTYPISNRQDVCRVSLHIVKHCEGEQERQQCHFDVSLAAHVRHTGAPKPAETVAGKAIAFADASSGAYARECDSSSSLGDSGRLVEYTYARSPRTIPVTWHTDPSQDARVRRIRATTDPSG